jgi:hypothetical protein
VGPLGLKLVLVPAFLLGVSLAGRRWGPAVAGRLAGLPVVAGPIVGFVAAEQGVAFATGAASAALASVFASVVFYLAYAHATIAWRHDWPVAIALALAAWFAAAFALTWVPATPSMSALFAVVTLAAGPSLFPRATMHGALRAVGRVDLAARMASGACLTLIVTTIAAAVGPRWSGLLAMFPILGSVLAVFSHRAQGAAFTAALLRGLTSGLYSLAAFFAVLTAALPTVGAVAAFAIGIAAALIAQVLVQRIASARRDAHTA